jgi:hypothetical protein
MPSVENSFLLPLFLPVSQPGTIEIVPGRGFKNSKYETAHEHDSMFVGDCLGARSFTRGGEIFFTKIFSSKLKADLIGDVDLDAAYFCTDDVFQEFAFGEFSAAEPLCLSFRAATISPPPFMNMVLVYRELVPKQAA